MKSHVTYSIQNANFTSLYNSLSIFTQVIFDEADTINHKYTASLNLWRKVLHIENNFLYQLKNQFDANKSLITQAINNIINYNLINVNTRTKLTFNNETKTITEWSKQTVFSQYDCLYIYYIYGLKTLEKIIFANMPSINVEVNWQTNGKLITYNNITNNISGWAKLVNLNNNYVYQLISTEPEAFFKKLKEKPNNNRIFKINGLYATYEQWSLFINKPKTYLDNMCYSMGYKYTYNFLYATVVNNQDFITKNKTVTVNNKSLTLYGWAKKINRSPSLLYNLNKTYGIDYVIDYINKRLIKESKI